jgi:hypothetical protein
MNDYVTVTELSKKMNSSNRHLQKKIKALLIENPTYKDNLIQYIKYKYYIHKSIISEFEPVYKKKYDKPKEETINNIEWDVFGDFLPKDSTPLKVLVTSMEYLFDELRKALNEDIKMYFVVEHQPNANRHVHYFIKYGGNDWGKEFLLFKIVDILNWCNQDIKDFTQELVTYATNYLEKGRKVNFKGATLLHSQLLVARKRKNDA